VIDYICGWESNALFMRGGLHLGGTAALGTAFINYESLWKSNADRIMSRGAGIRFVCPIITLIPPLTIISSLRSFPYSTLMKITKATEQPNINTTTHTTNNGIKPPAATPADHPAPKWTVTYPPPPSPSSDSSSIESTMIGWNSYSNIRESVVGVMRIMPL